MKKILCMILVACMLLSIPAAASAAAFSVSADGAAVSTDGLTVTLTFPRGTSAATVCFHGDAAVYADPALTRPVALTAGKVKVSLRQMHTYLYADHSGFLYTVDLISPRAAANYKDAEDFADWAKYYIQYLNYCGFGLMTGDGVCFRPKNMLTRFETAVLAAKLLGVDTALISCKNPYADKLVGWAKPSVLVLTGLGILHGEKTDCGLIFAGERSVTRAEIAKIFTDILRLLRDGGESAASLIKENGYTLQRRGFADTADVAAWAAPALTLAVCRYKLIEGSRKDGALWLYPCAAISRAEIAVMIGKLNNYNGRDLLQGTLSSLSAVYAEESRKDTVMSKAFVKAYDAAVSAVDQNAAGSTCKQRFDALMKALRNRWGGLIYLSPSRQMNNAYSGYNTTEGGQMIKVGTRVFEILKQKGYDVFLTSRETTQKERAKEAGKLNAVCYVAIHSNAIAGTNDGSARGTIIYYSNNPGSKALAEAVYTPLAACTPTKDHGIRNNSLANIPYTEICLPTMANILAEVEFHDYAPYAKWIIDHREDLAVSITNGIETYMSSLYV